MKKPQYIVVFVAVALTALLLIFGRTAQKSGHSEGDGYQHEMQSNEKQEPVSHISFDTLLSFSKQSLTAQQAQKLIELEKNAKDSLNKTKQLEAFHQLSHFWRDEGKSFIPYAWYSAESARLENSEKNLTFAAHLFLDRLQQEENADVRKWLALQAKDLFERSLSMNPNNDSTKVSLGATYIFGGISQTPMEGIAKVREVVEKDSTNVYAQMTLAAASIMSGQIDKAKGRLQTIVQLQPQNIQALLMLGDIAEKEGDKTAAIGWYSKSLPLINRSDIKTEIEKRISELRK